MGATDSVGIQLFIDTQRKRPRLIPKETKEVFMALPSDIKQTGGVRMTLTPRAQTVVEALEAEAVPIVADPTGHQRRVLAVAGVGGLGPAHSLVLGFGRRNV